MENCKENKEKNCGCKALCIVAIVLSCISIIFSSFALASNFCSYNKRCMNMSMPMMGMYGRGNNYNFQNKNVNRFKYPGTDSEDEKDRKPPVTRDNSNGKNETKTFDAQ